MFFKITTRNCFIMTFNVNVLHHKTVQYLPVVLLELWINVKPVL